MTAREENAREARRAEEFAADYVKAVAKLRGYPGAVPREVADDIHRMTGRYDDIYGRLYSHGYTARTVAEVIQYEAWDHGY
jgi:hypothetical protein